MSRGRCWGMREGVCNRAAGVGWWRDALLEAVVHPSPVIAQTTPTGGGVWGAGSVGTCTELHLGDYVYRNYFLF